jgi:hypothetical protein
MIKIQFLEKRKCPYPPVKFRQIGEAVPNAKACISDALRHKGFAQLVENTIRVKALGTTCFMTVSPPQMYKLVGRPVANV